MSDASNEWPAVLDDMTVTNHWMGAVLFFYSITLRQRTELVSTAPSHKTTACNQLQTQTQTQTDTGTETDTDTNTDTDLLI